MIVRTLTVVTLLLTAACAGESAAPTASAVRLNQSGYGATVNTELAALRRATAAFHNPSTAAAAGWGVAITGCMENGSAGAMGVHIGNPQLIDDDEVIIEQPELLMYEPGPNGTKRLVGVEYIIPYTRHPREATPPKLFGREFAQVDGSLVWGLHAWVWADNPAGMFEPWNPRVSCRHDATASRAHQH